MMVEPWFDPVAFGAWYGGVVGGVGGTLAGLLGGAIGVCAQRGALRRTLIGMMWFFVAFGIINILFGGLAYFSGQPWSIWYGPLLAGVILAVVMGSLIPVALRAYARAERRRLDARLMREL